MTAPCGVPSSAAVTTPSSMNPALSHLLIRRITRESNTMFEETNQPLVANRVKEPADIGVQNPAHLCASDPDRQCIQRVVLPTLWPKSVREPHEVLLVNCIEYFHKCALNYFVFQRCNTQRTLSAIRLRVYCLRDGFA